MKTDNLFYELFRAFPRSLFEMAGLETEGEYVFESITVKSTEKRFDGFMRRTDGAGPNCFAEFQGYDDKKIYWRFFREISAWHEQNDDETPFVAIVVFLDKKFKPKRCPLLCAKPNRMIRITLTECLENIGDRASVLSVLKPFGLSDKKKLPESAAKWKAEIDSLGFPENKAEKLSELLEYFILQCFPKLTLKEIQTMIRLTPLEETVAGKELIQIGMDRGVALGKKEGRLEGKKEGRLEGKKEGRLEGKKEGKKEGRLQGELIGKIQMMQRFLKKRQTSKAKLVRMSTKELRDMLKKLEADLD